jgi:hypothetical protein
MDTILLKSKITKAVNEIDDESFLEAIYVIINKHSAATYELNEDEIQLLNERKELYESGKANTFSVQEVREKILKNIGNEI